MKPDELFQEYFRWIRQRLSFPEEKAALLHYLFCTPYLCHNPLDQNRAVDGLFLRRRFAGEKGYSWRSVEGYFVHMECSMLEMMAALAIRCEDTIMHDDRFGDRTGKWFAYMLYSLGFPPDGFDQDAAGDILDRFLHGDYAPNGKGGLFYVPGCRGDLRREEIWYQMMRYLEREE